MRPYSRLLVVAILSAAAFAGCGSDSKKILEAGTPDSPVLDTSLPDTPAPDVSVSADSEDATPADAASPDLVDVDAFLPEDAQQIETPRSRPPLTPDSANLLTVWGCPSSPVTFTVDRGDGSGAVPTVIITGTNARYFSFTTDCNKPLVGDAPYSCQVTVVYNPAQAFTEHTATLTVAVGDASYSATLTGTAIHAQGPSITGTPTDFGEVVVGSTSKETTFTITNNGGDNIAADGINVSTSVGQFEVVTDNCTGKGIPIKGLCTFTVRFRPAAGDQGGVTGQLKAMFCTDCCVPPAFIGVWGTAVPKAKLAIIPSVLEFGSAAIMQESQPLTLTAYNVGGVPTGALRVDNTGAQFKIKGDNCTGARLTATGASGSCSVIVTYTPVAQPSEATGTVTVSDTTGTAAAPVTATLHGTGGAHATLVMSPATVCPQNAADDPLCLPAASTHRFNNVQVGQTSPGMTFVVTNTTSPTDAPDSGSLQFVITGEAAADFTIVENNCTTLLSTSTGTTCSVKVTFKPSVTGLRKAILGGQSSRGGSAQATLEGKGLS
jgi:hypothetical protein